MPRRGEIPNGGRQPVQLPLPPPMRAWVDNHCWAGRPCFTQGIPGLLLVAHALAWTHAKRRACLDDLCLFPYSYCLVNLWRRPNVGKSRYPRR
jgi:hypothetical protein